MKAKSKVSAIVITKNEEKKIRDCLKTLSWCDEIIVIDSGSTDKTVEIARKQKAKVFKFNGGSYSNWRNQGLKKASSDWVLYVDADERVTKELQKEIELKISSIQQVDQKFAYAIPRKNIILGKELRYGGWWPDYVKRLFLKAKIKYWMGELHEEPLFDGELGYLKNPFIHIKHDNLLEMVEKTNIWSEIEARLMYKAGHPPMTIVRFLSAMFREFWLRFVKYKAFLDGSEGIIYGFYQVYSRFISYAKLWEMQVRLTYKK